MIDGKVANQYARLRTDGTTFCSKCSKSITPPRVTLLNAGQHYTGVGTKEVVLHVSHYINEKEFIYESKSGKATCYCSEYCAKKHNHRFNT